MFNLAIPWFEFVVRGAIVYIFLLLLLRLTGRRQVGQLAPFDLILLLVLSNAVQNSMTGGDNSLIGGLICATTLVLLNFGVSFATYRNKRLEALIEGRQSRRASRLRATVHRLPDFLASRARMKP
jgi:uncharacterized membrane protein YcaP (DUF421 family)